MEIGRSRLPDPPKLPPVGHAARGPYSSQAVVAQDTYSQHVANYVDIRWTLVRKSIIFTFHSELSLFCFFWTGKLQNLKYLCYFFPANPASVW